MKKRILITGCSKKNGVGFQLAHELLKRGHEVIATVRDITRCDLSSESAQNPKNLQIKNLDLCELGSIELLIDEVLKEHGYIDVLVNNAANVAYGPVETLSQNDLQITFQTKVFGPVALIQGFLPSMRTRKQGLLITTSSMFCALPVTLPGFSAYISAINAFESIQQCLAVELQPWNVDVVNFQTGPISTSLTKFKGEKTDQFKEEYAGYIDKVYQWVVDNLPYQTAEEVAKVYADVIESSSPTLTVQSSEFSKQFVKTYRDDETSMNPLKQWLERVSRNS